MTHLLVTNDYPPKVGGIQNYLWDLYRHLPQDDIAVFTTPYDGAGEFDDVSPHRIRRHERFWLSPTPDVVAAVRRQVAETGASFVMIDPAVPLGVIGPRLGVPYGLIVHGTEATVPVEVPGIRSLTRRIVDGAVLMASSSDWATGVMRQRLGAIPETVYVPPGVDTQRFVPLTTSERAAARRRFGIPDDATVVASVSRLVPRKGMDVLIRATANLAADHPELQTIIGGTGRDRDRLEGIVGNTGAAVRFLGRVPEHDLPALYGCADIFAMLCRNRWGGLEQEGFGIVFVEAAAAGTPQLAGRSGGAGEAVADGQTGFVVDDPGEVAAVIKRQRPLVADEGLRSTMGEQSRQRAVDEFDQRLLSQRYLDALEKVI